MDRFFYFQILLICQISLSFCCYFAYLRISETIYLLQGEQGERGPEGNVGPPGFQVWFIQYSDIYANAFGEENRLINTVLLNLGILYLFT